jgi:hypothetical protein
MTNQQPINRKVLIGGGVFVLLLISYIIYKDDPHFKIFPWAMLGIGIILAPFGILGGLALRRDRKAAKSEAAAPTPPATGLGYWDKFFSSLGGCTLTFACVVLPAVALLVGIIGLIVCRDEAAWNRALQMTTVSAILVILAVLCLALMLSGASPQGVR